MAAGVREHALDVVVDAGARVEARGERLGEADAEVDRRELAEPCQRAHHLERAQRQRRRLLQESEVVGPQDLVEVEVLELGGDTLVEDLHHFVGGDAVGEHGGDEGAGARAHVDVEVVDGAVGGEQVERPQGADLIDAAREAAAAQDEGRLRRAFAGAPPSRLSVDVHNFAHKHGLSQDMRRTSCLLVTLLLLLAALLPQIAPARAASGKFCQALRGAARARGRAGERPFRGRRRDGTTGLREGREAPAPARLEHEAVHDRDRPRALPSRCADRDQRHRRRAGRHARRAARKPLPEGRRRPDPRQPRLL